MTGVHPETPAGTPAGDKPFPARVTGPTSVWLSAPATITPLGTPPATAVHVIDVTAENARLRAELAALDSAHKQLDALLATHFLARQSAEQQRDQAYRERAQLVAFLAACYPNTSYLANAPDAGPGWMLVYVEAPAGQMSWHVAEADLPLFDHLVEADLSDIEWDGHTTEEKYRRLESLVRSLASRKAPAYSDEMFYAWRDAEYEITDPNCSWEMADMESAYAAGFRAGLEPRP